MRGKSFSFVFLPSLAYVNTKDIQNLQETRSKILGCVNIFLTFWPSGVKDFKRKCSRLGGSFNGRM